MADQLSAESSSKIEVSSESSESTVQLNIKTLDSRIFTFHADKHMSVSSFKEQIANEVGVPVGQQRLIFRGKVLKDDHFLSEYHVETGHTLHLVERQPAQSPPSGGTSSGEANGNSSNRGTDASSGAPRNRVGQISHSVVLGTFNVGDQGEGVGPDLSRVIGAVLNSFGIGGQPTNGTGSAQSSTTSNATGQTPQGNEREGVRGNAAGQNQARNQAFFGQGFPGQPFQSSPQAMQIPLTGAAFPIPSLNSPIPDSLNTLSEFMNRMELALSQDGNQPNLSTNAGDLPTAELPSTARGLPTPEALSIVLRHAQRLLSDHAVAALSHIAGRLEQDGASADPTVRGQIQTESMRLGLAMQHLGALFLELGRTILTLRMGQPPAEASVNAGPAVYISPSGPNPIMVQPFPFQTSSLFGGSTVPSTAGTFGPGGSVPRHINIHIHAVGTRPGNGDGVQGERVNGTGSADSGPTRVLPVRNVTATAVPIRPAVVATSARAPPGVGVSVSQPPSDPAALSSVVAEINSRIREILVDNIRGENQTPSGQSENSTDQNLSASPSNVGDDQVNSTPVNGVGGTSVASPGFVSETEDKKTQPKSGQVGNNPDIGGNLSLKDSTCSVEGSSGKGETSLKSKDSSDDVPRTNERNNAPEGTQAAPLGLGLGGLQPKRRTRQLKPQVKNSDGGTSSTSDLDQQTREANRQLLQSLASRNRRNPSTSSGHGSFDQMDPASIMSQVVQSPALNGLLSGVSEQTGAGSPDVLRNMLEQFSQNPVMRNAVNQIAQQVDGQDLGSMFSGMGVGGGQGSGGGGLDLSRMVQQMMPIVTRALSSGSSGQQRFQMQSDESRLSRGDMPDNPNSQVGLQQVIQRIEQQDPPSDIFGAVTENAVSLYGNGSGFDGLVEELCSDDALAGEYVEMLRKDVRHRVEGEPGTGDKC